MLAVFRQSVSPSGVHARVGENIQGQERLCKASAYNHDIPLCPIKCLHALVVASVRYSLAGKQSDA